MYRYLKVAIESLPTLFEGHMDDLKIDTDTLRVWVSRVDGSISVEKRILYGSMGFKWTMVEEFKEE